MQLLRILTCAALLCLSALHSTFANMPAIEQGNRFKQGIDVSQYLASEKLDGIRATWVNKQLLTRNGHVIYAPAWFSEGWPDTRLDGELWAGVGQFNLVSHTVRDQVADEQQWQQIRFMVFDAPSTKPFSQRYTHYMQLVKQANSHYLQAVEQHQFADYQQLEEWFKRLVKQGSEGVMLHKADAPFAPGRSDTILKLKPYMDAEAQVIGYTEGKGKYAGKVGALIMQMPDGKQFKLGSGLTDALRTSPPPIGSIVTYRFHGFTKNGLPRFASYLRLRNTKSDL